MNDGELFEAFREGRSESAFSELVNRHVHLVYTVAKRVLGESSMVEEVPQIVFALLAQKARALPSKTILAGWLHRTAYFTALKIQRDEWRRQKRE